MRCAILALAGALLAGPAFAQDADEGALRLADEAPETREAASDWRAFVEAGVSELRLGSGGSEQGERASFDLHDDSMLAPAVRFLLSDRLDLEHIDHPSSNGNVNTLKEAYFSWQPDPNLILDAGRVNLRYGVATGYNPTDFFRAFAIRSIVSLDPSSLRENRQGSVIFEGQWLGEQGSVSAVLSPKLADHVSNATFSPDLGATNPENRWLLAASGKIVDGVTPQALLFGGEHQSTQLGANLSTLVNNATTAYVEWSGGRAAPLAAQAFDLGAPDVFQRRLAVGTTYTTDFNLTLTAEYESNSAGLDRVGLNRVIEASPLALLGYLAYISGAQDLPTKRGWFASGSWTDAGLQHLDITVFTRIDPVSRSHLRWGEMRYHFVHADIAMQLEFYGGNPHSIYGAIPAQRSFEVLLRYFL
jgi:hypothetical protein